MANQRLTGFETDQLSFRFGCTRQETEVTVGPPAKCSWAFSEWECAMAQLTGQSRTEEC